MPRHTTNTILDRINVASPCSADWDSMIGNQEVRFCQHCSKHVNNLSEMTRKQALQLVARSNGRLCVKYKRGPDGRIEMARTDSQLYQIKRRVSRLAAGAFTAALSLCSSVAAQTPSPNERRVWNGVEVTDLYDSARHATSGGASASLRGVITDPNGAVIPGGTMTLVNDKTKQSQTATTDNDGQYRFQYLEPGTYTLRLEASGFASSEIQGLDIQAGQEQNTDMAATTSEVYETMGIIMVSPADPLVIAATENDLAKVKELIAAGVDVNRRDENTETTALEKAVEHGNRQMVRALLDAGAEINARNSYGATALMMLDEDATEELVWDLVAAGAKINLRDTEGDTALILVAARGHSELVRALINAGARVNARNKNGETPLMKAAESGDLESVKLLIDFGADINRKNNSGETALKLAEDNEHEDVVEQLEAYQASK